ncbi:MAG: polysaccharide deacetylase family protein [Clostridia bacterium]|nr:polysaccharide deacetylase family protein [Clostridia bacterium]
MDREKAFEGIMNCINVLILVMIAVLYAATGTRLGEDAIAAMKTGGIYRGGRSGTVALACSVTWDAENLSDMLDTLEERGVQITFFVSGEWARSHASTLERMTAAGHEIGTSGYAPLLDGDLETVQTDISVSAAVISSITGQSTRLYYAGLREPSLSQAAGEAAGLVRIAGSADLLSARGEAADIVARASEQAFDGSILVLQPTAQAAEALPAMIDAIHEKGYRIGPVGGMI